MPSRFLRRLLLSQAPWASASLEVVLRCDGAQPPALDRACCTCLGRIVDRGRRQRRGKSTVANALLGLWPFQAGEIRTATADSARWTWRRCVGMIKW